MTILKGEDQLTKRQYVQASTVTATLTSSTAAITIAPTITSIAAICKIKSIKITILRSI